MNGHFTIALLVCLLFLLPYLRIFVKRIVFSIKLWRICHKRHFTCRGTHPCWLFSPWWYPRADFVVRGDHYVYPVKFFASKSSTRRLVFSADGRHFHWVKKLALTGRSPHMAILEIPGKVHPLPDYDFSIPGMDLWNSHMVMPILLVHPICHEFRQAAAGPKEERLLGSWEIIGGVYVCSARRFLDHLETYEHQNFIYR